MSISSKWNWVLTGCLMVMAACTSQAPSEGDPKGRLQRYISKTFAIQNLDDRKELGQYLDQDLKNRLLSWSEDQFRSAFIDSKRKFVKLAFKEVKEISKDVETSITYELSFIDPSKGSNVEVIQKKTAILVKKENVWLIREVRNIKELIDYKNEMTFP